MGKREKRAMKNKNDEVFEIKTYLILTYMRYGGMLGQQMLGPDKTKR